MRLDTSASAALLQKCGDHNNLQEARRLHSFLAAGGMLSSGDAFLGNKLITAYSKCGQIHESRSVFDDLKNRQIFSWCTMMSAYIRSSHIGSARQIFDRMPERNAVAWNSIISGYAQLNNLLEARKLLHQMPEPSASAFTVIIRSLASAGYLKQASETFHNMPERDLVSWNVMIAAHSQCGDHRTALQLFKSMDIQPDHVTLLSALDACGELGDLLEARVVYSRVVDMDLLQKHPALVSAAISTFGKCGSVTESREIFDSLPERNAQAWNALLTAYAVNGDLQESLGLFNQMPEKTEVSWNAIISACAAGGQGKEALHLFRTMDLEGAQPNTITFTAAIDACTSIAALAQGKLIHGCMTESDERASVALIRLFAKCGSLEGARSVFETMKPGRTPVSWNCMVGSYASNARGEQALELFTRMLHEGVPPTSITFVSVLSSCSHEGRLSSAGEYLRSITSDHQLELAIDHFNCLLDLLGRSGRLRDAAELIESMPFEPDAASWRIILNACKIHRSHTAGIRAAKRAVELDAENTPAYVQLSNLYAECSNQADAARIRRLMHCRKLRKHPGLSCIEVNDRVHEFVAGDESHPRTKEIQSLLLRLKDEIVAAGYEPDTSTVLHDVRQDEKDRMITFHSEKLAIGFGLLSTPPGSPLRIVKNLRVCLDCHSAIKFISRITSRDIVVRDANRFHRFENGSCSCGDYW